MSLSTTTYISETNRVDNNATQSQTTDMDCSEKQ